MPLIPKYNIVIPCKKCGTQFLKEYKSGNICNTCKRIARNECRSKNLYSICRICGVEKETNQAVYCPQCHKEKYRGKYTKRDLKKIEQYIQSAEVNKELTDLVYRIKYKQASFIYSLYDINDIINMWYKICKGRNDIYDLYSSGEQVSRMWFDIVETYDKSKST